MPLDIRIARLVDRFGAIVLMDGIDVFSLIRMGEISAVESIYGVAGTKQQRNLNAAQWEYIKWLDEIAGQEEDA